MSHGVGPDILVAGDALIDLTPVTTRPGTTAYEPHPGGSSLNVAVGLARLEVATAFLARVSTDAWGEVLRTHLAGSGVQPGLLVDTDDLTTLAAVHLRDGQASYSFHAAQAADRGLLPAQLPELPAGAALHLGSIALVLEPTASTLEGLLRREAGQRVISLDPNVRPGLIADRDAYVRRFAGWVRLVDVLKVSTEDLAWLHPDRPADEVVAGWHAAGVSLVLITSGEHGARASTRTGGSIAVVAPRVEVVDTVGAGDAFTAAALAHLHEGGLLSRDALPVLDDETLRGLLDAACRVAADTCTRAGAEPPRGWPAPAASAATPGRPVGGPEPVETTLAELVERARALAQPGRRRILGITGAPGAGKSTIARHLVDQLGPDLAVLAPMDGFHLSNQSLVDTGRRSRKGAWDTFDADGYLCLLRRLQHQEDDIVHAPDFDRGHDESIGSALPLRREVPLIVTEGNYLLSEEGAWGAVAPLLDQSWYVQVSDATRQERLTLRHQQHGMSPDQAADWARGVDQANADLVVRGMARADLVVVVAP